MKKLKEEMLLLYAAVIACLMIVSPIVLRIPRTRGRNILGHVFFVIVVVVSLMFIPRWVQDEIFSPGGILVLSTFPAGYESISCLTRHDRYRNIVDWLQFWVASRSFALAGEFLDNLTEYMPNAGEHWFEFEFFVVLWMMFPLTDGSGLMYDLVTKPFLLPVVGKAKGQLEGFGQSVLMVVINSKFIWLIWFAFTTLPEEERRFLTVALGTVYPAVASIVSMAKPAGTTSVDPDSDAAAFLLKEERFWLTYWTCYSLLIMMMDYLENFLGEITGFYSICALCTLYLFLPLFRGAEVVFRSVLVPLTGHSEELVLQDVHVFRHELEARLRKNDATSRKKIMEMASTLFSAPPGSASTESKKVA